MSVLDQAVNVRAIYEAFQARSFERSSEWFAEDAEIINMATGDTFRGREGYLQFARGWASAFPDLRVEVLRYQATDSWASVEFALRGTHTGAFLSSGGFIPPTWSQVDLRVCDAVQMRDGKISALHSYFDTATMLRQMGLFPNSPLHTADRRAPLELYATEVDAATEQRNKAIVNQFLEEVLNLRNPAAAASFCSSDLVWHGGAMGEAVSLDAFQTELHSIFQSFPDLSVEVHDVIAEQDRVAVRLTMRGTQLGSFHNIPPTGRKITSSAMNTYRIHDNRIVEEWWQHDLLGVMKQLNAAPASRS